MVFFWIWTHKCPMWLDKICTGFTKIVFLDLNLKHVLDVPFDAPLKPPKSALRECLGFLREA